MFDLNITKKAFTDAEQARETNRQLSRLLTDLAAGRGYMIVSGATTVSVVTRQDGERRILKVYPTPLLQAKRYTKEEAIKRQRALKDPTAYEVVRLREAVARQGDAMDAYIGEMQTLIANCCRDFGMEVTA